MGGRAQVYASFGLDGEEASDTGVELDFPPAAELVPDTSVPEGSILPTVRETRARKRSREEGEKIAETSGRPEPVTRDLPAADVGEQAPSSELEPLAFPPLRSLPPELRTKRRHDKGKSPATSSATAPAPAVSKKKKKSEVVRPPRAPSAILVENVPATGADFREYERVVLPTLDTEVLFTHMHGSLGKVFPSVSQSGFVVFCLYIVFCFA